MACSSRDLVSVYSLLCAHQRGYRRRSRARHATQTKQSPQREPLSRSRLFRPEAIPRHGSSVAVAQHQRSLRSPSTCACGEEREFAWRFPSTRSFVSVLLPILRGENRLAPSVSSPSAFFCRLSVLTRSRQMIWRANYPRQVKNLPRSSCFSSRLCVTGFWPPPTNQRTPGKISRQSCSVAATSAGNSRKHRIMPQTNARLPQGVRSSIRF